MSETESNLVQLKDGSWHRRYVPNVRDAAVAVQCGRMPTDEQILRVMGWKTGAVRSTEFARKLGVSGQTIRRAYRRGSLPGAVEHSSHILVIPGHLLRLAEAFGLRGVERLAKAGKI